MEKTIIDVDYEVDLELEDNEIDPDREYTIWECIEGMQKSLRNLDKISEYHSDYISRFIPQDKGV